MRKTICIFMAALMLFFAAACSSGKKAPLEYGSSALYTHKDIDEAAALVKKEFATFEGCELHSLRYPGDECNSEENLRWLNELDPGHGYAQVLELLTDFRSGKTGAWDPDTEYRDYQWWLAREEGGSWQLISWGY